MSEAAMLHTQNEDKYVTNAASLSPLLDGDEQKLRQEYSYEAECIYGKQVQALDKLTALQTAFSTKKPEDVEEEDLQLAYLIFSQHLAAHMFALPNKGDEEAMRFWRRKRFRLLLALRAINCSDQEYLERPWPLNII